MLTPLAPVGGNLTQSIYLVADLACFVAAVGVGALHGGLTLAKAMVAYAALNMLFALLDLGTYYTDMAALLDPIRNSQYTLYLDEVTSGMKRIAGSFTETSSFSSATPGALGLTGTLWLYGRWATLTGSIAAASTVLLVLPTSSTSIIAAFFLIGLLYVTALGQIGRGRGSRVAAGFAVAAPAVAILVAAAVMLSPSAFSSMVDDLNVLLFEKSASQSGVERASWNAVALQNFLDTDGLGAGLGSVRASSFLLAALAHTRQDPQRGADAEADLRVAARNGCLGLLLAAVISDPLVDIGLQFYLLAGLAGTPPVARHTAAVRTAVSQESLA